MTAWTGINITASSDRFFRSLTQRLNHRKTLIQFCRSMARPHVPHNGTGDTCSRPRERFASCGHLPVPDVCGQRTGSESSERRRYRGQVEHLQVKLHPGRTIVSSPANHSLPPRELKQSGYRCVAGIEPNRYSRAREKKLSLPEMNSSLRRLSTDVRPRRWPGFNLRSVLPFRPHSHFFFLSRERIRSRV